MWKIHWEAMSRILELGYADKVLARYNSNMSRINFYGKNLFGDILKYYPRFQICASMDGTGEIGEYIRTGLKYDEWLNNMKYAVKFADKKSMKVDMTTANAIIKVHDALSGSSQKKFEDMLNKSKATFAQTVDFVWKAIK